MTHETYHLDKIFCHHKEYIFFKNIFKVALQYFLNVFIIFNIVFNLKFNFKLKLDPKMHTYKNLEKIFKTWKKLEKVSGNPVNKIDE